MIKKDYKRRLRKKVRIKKKVFGTAEKPRLAVFRSLKQIYVQLIDDTSGRTLVATSSLSKEITDQVKESKGKTETCKIVGEVAAKKAIGAGIKSVVFDRGGYKYHGRVKSIAEGARKAGLQI